MNLDYNTSLKGHYTLYNEDMQVLCETDNLITDWGMRRFVGDRSTGAPHPADTDESQQAFVNNLKHINLGLDGTTENYSDFTLSAIPSTDYVDTNEASTTGTLLSTDPVTQNLIINFTRMTRFKMASSFNTTLAPLSTYTIREIGCNWSTTTSQDNRYGIFSRATLPTPVTIRPNNTVFAKYTLTVTTNFNQVLSSMPRLSGTGSTPFPVNKTNIRTLPFYTLQSNGNPSSLLNAGVSRLIGHSGQRTKEYVPPLLEDPGSHNTSYVGSGAQETTSAAGVNLNYQDALLGTSGKRIWWLQMYTSDWSVAGTAGGSNPANRYDTFVSTTTSVIGNSPDIYVDSTAWVKGGTTVGDIIYQNLNHNVANPNITGRLPAELEILTNVGNTWTRTLRFLFTPRQFKPNTTVLNLYRATLGNWDNWTHESYYYNGAVYYDVTATHTYGIVTALSGTYTPNPSFYDGVEYKFTFTRA